MDKFLGLYVFSPKQEVQQIKVNMLSSSEAKWRCLWHLLVWSVLLTLFIIAGVQLSHHVAMMMLAAFVFILLPVITAIYSNTSGKHGAGLLRASYILCDPVLACISELPVMLVHDLPVLLQKQACYTQYSTCENETIACLRNLTSKDDKFNSSIIKYTNNEQLERKLDVEFLIMECALIVPILFSLLMGKRTRKMSYDIYIITFIYWFIAGIEAASILDISRQTDRYIHIICTVESMLVIVMTVANSYALVTLCSYIVPSPATATSVSPRTVKKFNSVYGNIVAISGVLFAECPLLIAKIQMIGSSQGALFPGTFYIWMVKDVIFSGVLVFVVVNRQLLKRQSNQIPCRTKLFDNSGVYFQPEKRDYYIQQTRLSYESSLDGSQASDIEKVSLDSKPSSDTDSIEKPVKKKKSVRFKFDLGKAGFSIVNAKEDVVSREDIT